MMHTGRVLGTRPFLCGATVNGVGAEPGYFGLDSLSVISARRRSGAAWPWAVTAPA
jgi:hypothetical protein